MGYSSRIVGRSATEWDLFRSSLPDGLSQVQLLIVESAFARDDLKKINSLLANWKISPRQIHICKWIPGDHYYVGGDKFDSYGDAERHATSLGYMVLGLREKHTYRNPGD